MHKEVKLGYIYVFSTFQQKQCNLHYLLHVLFEAHLILR